VKLKGIDQTASQWSLKEGCVLPVRQQTQRHSVAGLRTCQRPVKPVPETLRRTDIKGLSTIKRWLIDTLNPVSLGSRKSSREWQGNVLKVDALIRGERNKHPQSEQDPSQVSHRKEGANLIPIGNGVIGSSNILKITLDICNRLI